MNNRNKLKLRNARIENLLELKAAIERIRNERGNDIEYLLCFRTLNQDLEIGTVVISGVLIKYNSMPEAELMLNKFQEAFPEYWVWIL